MTLWIVAKTTRNGKIAATLPTKQADYFRAMTATGRSGREDLAASISPAFPDGATRPGGPLAGTAHLTDRQGRLR